MERHSVGENSLTFFVHFHSLQCFSLYTIDWQIPRYIITLHELLAHTPHEHVERKSLEFAKSKLEELSRWEKHPEANSLKTLHLSAENLCLFH